uniref:Cytochrome b5 domain containing 1 n=1 Tax=Sinocyclocheilus grahami TaxID=75366 RepID=A0A672TB24_SINGR
LNQVVLTKIMLQDFFSQLYLSPQFLQETLDEIIQRYLRYNSHAASYTWKHNGVNLDMSKTLSENGIPEEDEFYCGSPDCDLFSPSICLYFNDDLTEL